MSRAWVRNGWALGLVSLGAIACSRAPERHVQARPYVSAAEQRRIEERRAEERRAEERRAEERRAEERRAEERRAEERRDANRRADARARRSRAIGGGPADRATREAPPSVSSRIAAARCDREVKCNQVGAHGKYDSHLACVAELKRDIRHDLDGDDCANGFRAKELNDCLQAIRDEQCGRALDFDTVIRLRACRAENICVR